MVRRTNDRNTNGGMETKRRNSMRVDDKAHLIRSVPGFDGTNSPDIKTTRKERKVSPFKSYSKFKH